MAEPGLVGRRIRTYRRRLGMSQETLADRTGIARSQIAAVESGRRQAFAIDNLIRISDVLGVSVDQLVRPDPSDKPPATATASEPKAAPAGQGQREKVTGLA